MPIEIKPEMIKEIAENLDVGMVCFYHKTKGELEFYPDENNNPGFDEESWMDVMDKVSESREEYISFEPMDSRESFRVIENFIAQIDDIPTHNKFIEAVSRKKPFANFKNMLHYYPELLKQWYVFKNETYIENVKEQVEAANFDEEEL
jgi:hypothetical protein